MSEQQQRKDMRDKHEHFEEWFKKDILGHKSSYSMEDDPDFEDNMSEMAD